MSVVSRLGLDVAEDLAASYAALARARVHLLAAVEDLPGLSGEAGRTSAQDSPFTRALTHVIQSEWHYAMAQQCLRTNACLAPPPPDDDGAVALAAPAASIRERLLAALRDATEEEIGRVVAGASEPPRRSWPAAGEGGGRFAAGRPISFP